MKLSCVDIHGSTENIVLLVFIGYSQKERQNIEMHDSSHQAGDVPLVLFLHVDGQHLHTLLLHLGHLENVVSNKMIKNLGLLINVSKRK